MAARCQCATHWWSAAQNLCWYCHYY